jgi:hypothetical protein
MSRPLWPYVLLIAAVVAGRLLDRRFRLGNRTGTPWGEPELTPGREAAGWVVLGVAVLGSALLIAACPFRVE